MQLAWLSIKETETMGNCLSLSKDERNVLAITIFQTIDEHQQI